MLSSYQDKQLLVRWKKQYSVAARAAKQLRARKDIIDTSSPMSMRDDFVTVLNFIKEDMWMNFSATEYKLYKSGSEATIPTLGPGFSAMLSDGSIWAFDSSGIECSVPRGSLNNVCGTITIDVNGSKGPNMMGKDLQGVYVVKRGNDYLVYPFGQGEFFSCTNPASNSNESLGCSKEAMLVKSPDDMP